MALAIAIVKKLSMKQLLGNVSKFIPSKEVTVTRGDKEVIKEVPAIGETAWLANVVGIARNTKHGSSNYGDWTALLGDFVAEAIEGEKKGKRFRTGQLFLPDVVLNMIEANLGGNQGVEFAFAIGITAVDTEGERPSATGYEYTAKFLTEPTASDPMEALMARALPAPEKPAEIEAEKPAETPATDPAKGATGGKAK